MYFDGVAAVALSTDWLNGLGSGESNRQPNRILFQAHQQTTLGRLFILVCQVSLHRHATHLDCLVACHEIHEAKQSLCILDFLANNLTNMQLLKFSSTTIAAIV